MSQQKLEALSRGAGALLHMGPAVRLHEHQPVRTPGGVLALKPNQNFHKHSIEQNIVQAAASGVSSTTLNTAGQIDFRVPTSHLGILKNVAIELNVTNASANSGTYYPAPLWVNRLEVYVQNGARLLYQATGQQLFVDACLVSSEAWAGMASLVNSSSTFGAGSALATTVSRRFWIPLFNGPWVNAGGLFVPGFSDDLLVRVSFVPQAQIVESGTSPSLNLTAANLHMHCEVPDMDEHRRLHAEYRTGTKDFRFLHPTIQSVTQSFAASTSYNIQLSAFVGLCAWMHFFARADLSTSPNPRTFTNLVESYEFKDQAGKNIQGGSIIRADYAKAFLVPQWFPGQALHTNLNINSHAFCSSPQIVAYTGQCNGYQTLDGVEQLTITTPSGLSTASYQLDIISMMYAILRIEKGMPIIMNS